MLTFEVNLGAALRVINPQSTIVTELSDGRGDRFPAPGPFDPRPSNRIVQTDQEVLVKCAWTVEGTLAALLEGTWRCEVFLEQYGQGEASPGKYSRSVAHVQAFNHTYNVTIPLPGDESIGAGMYKIAVVVNLLGPAPANLPLPVAGFEELGTLQYYKAA